MSLQELLRSPPPATAWVLDSDTAAVVHRDGKGGLHCASEPVPAGVFEIGPVGLQGVDSTALEPLLARLKGAAEGSQTAAVITPTAWFRCYLIEADRLPRKQKELDDVVRWRLKKLLPIPPADLRLSVTRLPERDGRRQVLCLVGIERALTALEASVRSVGVEPGLITTRLLALAAHQSREDVPVLVIQQEPTFFSLVLLADGSPRVLRTKPLAVGGPAQPVAIREVGLTLNFIREDLGMDGNIQVQLAVENEGVESELRRWLAERSGLQPGAEPATSLCAPAAVAARVGAARLMPAVAVVTGGTR